MHKTLLELKEFVEEMGEVAQTFVFTPYGQLRVDTFTRVAYYRKLRKFKSAGLLKYIKTDNGKHFRLSDKAKHILRTFDASSKRTDGLSTIVTFDIPISKNRERTI